MRCLYAATCQIPKQWNRTSLDVRTLADEFFSSGIISKAQRWECLWVLVFFSEFVRTSRYSIIFTCTPSMPNHGSNSFPTIQSGSYDSMPHFVSDVDSITTVWSIAKACFCLPSAALISYGPFVNFLSCRPGGISDVLKAPTEQCQIQPPFIPRTSTHGL